MRRTRSSAWRRANWKQLRDRYSRQGWWPEQDETTLFDPAAVAVTRYRYRGNIASPWTEQSHRTPA